MITFNTNTLSKVKMFTDKMLEESFPRQGSVRSSRSNTTVTSNKVNIPTVIKKQSLGLR